MLSLDSALYSVPKKVKREGGSTFWVVDDRLGRERRITSELNFTLLPNEAKRLGLGHVEEKLTFYYGPQGNIKAAPRTLRKHGAATLGPIISRLMNVAEGYGAAENQRFGNALKPRSEEKTVDIKAELSRQGFQFIGSRKK
jgi:hypothetical protein